MRERVAVVMSVAVGAHEGDRDDRDQQAEDDPRDDSHGLDAAAENQPRRAGDSGHGVQDPDGQGLAAVEGRLHGPYLVASG